MKLFSTLVTTSLTAAAIAFGRQNLTPLVAFVALAFVQLPRANAATFTLSVSGGPTQNTTEGLVIPNGMNVVLGTGTTIAVTASLDDDLFFCNAAVYVGGRSTDGPNMLTILGGEYTSCGDGLYAGTGTVATVTICDGTFLAGKNSGAAAVYRGVFRVAGGTLNGAGEDAVALAVGYGNVTITGGTFTATARLLLFSRFNYNADIWGGSFQDQGDWFFYHTEGSLTVHGKKDLKLVGTNLVGTLCDGSFLNVSISGNLPSELNIIRNCAGFPKFPECGACAGGKSGKGNLFRP
jgi:hypothetical protein